MTNPMTSTEPADDAGEGCYVLRDRSDVEGAAVETFDSREHTASLWGPMQHGGPVAGLLTRAMDRLEPRPDTRITRVTVDLLGPVPIAPVRVTAREERPGRRIRLLSAVMEAEVDGRFRPVARASAWRLATTPTDDVAWTAPNAMPAPPDSDDGPAGLGIPESWTATGFVAATTWRFVQRAPDSDALPAAWLRLDRPLVEGEETTPLERAVTLSDTVNGIGMRLDPGEFTFLNTDLSVLLHTAPPEGDWCGFVAENAVGPDGVGTNSAVLLGAAGPVGRVTQNVLVERRASLGVAGGPSAQIPEKVRS